MSTAVTRRQFAFQTLGVIGGTMVAGDILPLLAEAAKHKQVPHSPEFSGEEVQAHTDNLPT
jgi:hypothetical protein